MTKTPKQILVEHIETMHRRQPLRSYTLKELSAWHAAQHHRYATSHRHLGPNTGPGDRPAGWYTGEGTVPRE